MSTNKKFLQSFIILLVAVLCTGNLNAQVTIGKNTAPKDFSLLEISADNKKGGLRLPQLETSERNALTNTPDAQNDPESLKGLVIYNTTNDSIEYWNGKQWTGYNNSNTNVNVNSNNEAKWFYMPSFVIDVSQVSPAAIDLYSEYEKQFKNVPGLLYQKQDLVFHILDYDNTVFSNPTINVNGELEYTVQAAATDQTFMNIAVEVK